MAVTAPDNRYNVSEKSYKTGAPVVVSMFKYLIRNFNRLYYIISNDSGGTIVDTNANLGGHRHNQNINGRSNNYDGGFPLLRHVNSYFKRLYDLNDWVVQTTLGTVGSLDSSDWRGVWDFPDQSGWTTQGWLPVQVSPGVQSLRVKCGVMLYNTSQPTGTNGALLRLRFLKDGGSTYREGLGVPVKSFQTAGNAPIQQLILDVPLQEETIDGVKGWLNIEVKQLNTDTQTLYLSGIEIKEI